MPPPRATEPAESRFRSAFEIVGPVVAPVGLLTGVLIYFGRVYTSARFSHFGIDSSVLNFSANEYALSSIQAIFVPLGAIIATGLLLVQLHLLFSGWITGRRHLRLLALLYPVIALGGVALLAVGARGLFNHPIFEMELLVTPLSFAFGTLGLSYAAHLHRKLHRVGTPPPVLNTGARLVSAMNLVMVAILVTLSIFWAMGDWAKGLGTGRGEQMAQDLASRPGVILYSKEALGIDPSTGVTVEPITYDQGPYRFRYRNLKLLLRTQSEYLLLPAGWSRPGGIAIVLPKSTAFRMEFTAR